MTNNEGRPPMGKNCFQKVKVDWEVNGEGREGEIIPFQVGLSKVDLLEDVKIQFIRGKVDKSIAAMYKKLQKNLTSEELLPSLWDKCKNDFLDKYETFVQLVARIYPAESVPSVAELRVLLASM
ncbi:Exocyst complex component SEC3A [Glycine max]|nr:Exocyst complex component SEC3A [Glycine max]